MLALIDQIKNSTQLRWNRVHKFQVKVKLNIELGSYTIQTAETPEQLIESFKLRHEVFNNEFRGLDGNGLDFDKFDYYFDHLIIIHRPTDKIIGTYRLNCSTNSKESYTAHEFDLSSLLTQEGPILELGRACIHKDFRKGSVISLLWRGIAEYMNLCNAKVLFGCSSLKVTSTREAALIYRYLFENGQVPSVSLSQPTKKYAMSDFKGWNDYFSKGLNEAQSKEAEDLIPSLLKSYLKLGVKIVSVPAFDEEFECIDLLTVLRKEDLGQALVQRFQLVR